MAEEDAQFVQDMLLATCLDGQCYELAIALHRGTGLPLVGLWSATASGDDGVPGTWRHAAVAYGGCYVDARGPVSQGDLGKPFGGTEPWDVRPICEDDLRRVRRVPEGTVDAMGRLAQAAWPDLPWKPESFQGRMEAFLADLEALSRRHRVWIRAPYPAARPVLALGDDDESGLRRLACLYRDGNPVRPQLRDA